MKFAFVWTVCCSAGSFLFLFLNEQTNMDEYFEASQPLVEVVQHNSEKVTADDVKLLLEFYRNHPILWSTSHPQYRNHLKKNKAKHELVEALGFRFTVEVLDRITRGRLQIRFFLPYPPLPTKALI